MRYPDCTVVLHSFYLIRSGVTMIQAVIVFFRQYLYIIMPLTISVVVLVVNVKKKKLVLTTRSTVILIIAHTLAVVVTFLFFHEVI